MVSPYGEYRRGIKKALAGSLIFHLVIILAGLIVIKAGKANTFLSPVYVELVSSAPKASGAAVENAPQKEPLKEAAERPEPAKLEAKKENPKAEQKAVTVKNKYKDKAKELAALEDSLKKVSERVKKRQDEAELEARLEALKKKQESESKEVSRRLDALKKELSSKRKSPVAAAAGPAGKVMEAKYPAYYSVIRDKVQEQWIYPEGFGADKVSIIISIRIGRNGRLMDSWVEKSSGNSRFDESLINAVRKASPFPALPQDFQGTYLETGLRFCPGCN